MKAKIKVANGYYFVGEIEVEIEPDMSKAYETRGEAYVAPIVAIIPNDGKHIVHSNSGTLIIEVSASVNRDNFEEWKKLRNL